jgi:hypothetical protein
MSATDKTEPLWQKFLERYKSFGAHFHGEGDPPDFMLEMRPYPDSQSWLWVWRPNGTERTDEVKNAMCWEMAGQHMPDEERRAFLEHFSNIH